MMNKQQPLFPYGQQTQAEAGPTPPMIGKLLNGLFLLEAGPEAWGFPRQVAIYVMYHDEMFLLSVCEPDEVRALLGDSAQRLITWQPCGLSDDVSGVWHVPSFAVPGWVRNWPTIKNATKLTQEEGEGQPEPGEEGGAPL
jgi:hypothetical protein